MALAYNLHISTNFFFSTILDYKTLPKWSMRAFILISLALFVIQEKIMFLSN